MEPALGCSLGLSSLHSHSRCSLKRFTPAGGPPPELALGHVCLTPLPPEYLTDGFSYTSIAWITIAGDGCQTAFRIVAYVYTPCRFYSIMRP